MIYEFDGFRADTKNKSLSHDGEPIAITPKVFDTLIILLENAPDLVETDRLIDLVWPDSFVEKSNLTFNIKMLRRAFGDDAADPRFIENVPRRGYRFIANVATIEAPKPKIAVRQTQNFQEIEVKRVGSRRTIGNNLQFVLGVAAGAVLIAMVLGLYFRSEANSRRRGFAQTTVTKLETPPNAFAAAISADGKYIVHASETNGKQTISVRQFGQERDIETHSLATGRILSINISPDNQSVLYRVASEDRPQSSLYRIPILGGASREILNNIESGVAFSPDGAKMAFIKTDPGGTTSQFMTANIDGTDQKLLAEKEYPERFVAESGAPDWISDGEILAVTGTHLPDSATEIVAVDALTGQIKPRLAIGWKGIRQIIRLNKNAALLVVAFDEETASDQIFRVDEASGRFEKISDGIGDFSSLSMTDDETTLIAVLTGKSTAIMVSNNADGENAATILTEDGNVSGDEGLAWTDDENLVAAFGPHRRDNLQLIERESVTPITIDSKGNRQPAICGEEIVFSSGHAGPDYRQVRLFATTRNGSGTRRIGTDESEPETFPSCGDGEMVVYQRGRENSTIWKIARRGGAPIRLTNYPSFQPAVSPDGKRVALFAFVDRRWSIDIISIENGELLKRIAVGQRSPIRHLRWSPDGRAVAYSQIENGVSNIWTRNVDGGEPQRLTNFDTGTILFFDRSRKDGKLAFARTESKSNIVTIRSSD